ncbi:MAG: T9SS type A sorting domain-containing protein, partial [Bacteroidota bacterium]
ETNIPYTLDASTFGMLNVFDLTGKVVLQERRLMASGRGNWLVSGDRLSHSGLYFYNIVTDSGHKSAGKIWMMQK